MKRGDWIAFAAAALVLLSLAFWPQQRQAANAARSARVTEMAEKWSGEIQFETSYDALDPAAGGAASATTRAGAAAYGFDPSDQYWGLPRNEGYLEVASYCAACHSLHLVMQQSRNERRWKETIDGMISRQGMPAPPEQERERIVRYLSRNFGERGG